MSEYKCKKCKLTYDPKRNKKACPYCGHKRKSKAPIVIIILMIICAVVTAVWYTSNNKTKYIDGLKFNLVAIRAETDPLTKLLTLSDIECIIEIENPTLEEKTLDCEVMAYVDDYQVPTSWFFSSSDIYIENLPSGKKCVQTVYINAGKEDWNKLEIFYRTDEDSEYKLLFTVYGKELKANKQ